MFSLAVWSACVFEKLVSSVVDIEWASPDLENGSTFTDVKSEDQQQRLLKVGPNISERFATSVSAIDQKNRGNMILTKVMFKYRD